MRQDGEVDDSLPAPDFGSLPKEVTDDLEVRVRQIPIHRVKRYADYWALLDVERAHVRKLAHRARLSAEDCQFTTAWWIEQVSAQLADTLGRLHSEDWEKTRSVMRRRPKRLHSNVSFQLWFNTIGPGGRCWLGNRYVTIRHFTFRVHWRA
jgi:hypothetical protein